MSTLQPGTILISGNRKYIIKNVLGRGGFGITYLAESRLIDGNVSFTVKYAIKEHFMPTCFRSNDNMTVLCTPSSKGDVELSRQDFISEAQRLQKLCQKNRNIVHVNETFEANGTAYYVMEYLDGGSPQMMSEEDALKFILPLSNALASLHKERILHLDIKPDNIVLKTDEDERYPVLIDFGIAKHFDKSGKPTSRLFAKGVSSGYAPIEQYKEIASFDPTIDIYALGGVLYFLLTGKNPPEATDVLVKPNIIEQTLPTSISPEVKALVCKAMAPYSERRYQSAGAFSSEISHILQTRYGNDVVISIEDTNQVTIK